MQQGRHDALQIPIPFIANHVLNLSLILGYCLLCIVEVLVPEPFAHEGSWPDTEDCPLTNDL